MAINKLRELLRVLVSTIVYIGLDRRGRRTPTYPLRKTDVAMTQLIAIA
jgi:hypothetical protein